MTPRTPKSKNQAKGSPSASEKSPARASAQRRSAAREVGARAVESRSRGATIETEGSAASDESDEAEDLDDKNGADERAPEEAYAELVDEAELASFDPLEAEREAKAKSSGALALARTGRHPDRFDPLETYMREIRAHSLLTPDEERSLALAYATSGDVNAAARLVTANLRLVVKIAYEYRRAYRNMMDLIQEGNMGLMQAVKKFDPYRGVKLSSYAAWWIRAYMLRFILSNFRLVKLGTTQAQRKLFFNLSKERARLSAMGIEPTTALIAGSLSVSEEEVEEMDRRMARSDASLDSPVNEADGRQTARVEMMPAPSVSPELLSEGAELSQLIRQNLDEFRETLSGKDLIIFDERISADEPRTLQDLGEQFGVSRERVRQLEARLTGKLRTFLTERLGDAVEIA